MYPVPNNSSINGPVEHPTPPLTALPFRPHDLCSPPPNINVGLPCIDSGRAGCTQLSPRSRASNVRAPPVASTHSATTVSNALTPPPPPSQHATPTPQGAALPLASRRQLAAPQAGTPASRCARPVHVPHHSRPHDWLAVEEQCRLLRPEMRGAAKVRTVDAKSHE